MPNPLGILGFLSGQLNTNQQGGILGQYANGGPRPFAPGEYLDNPNGSWSSEMSYTLQDPSFNRGLPTNVPGLWIVDGKPYHATEDEAAKFAAQSGLQWPTYNKIDEADAASAEREKNWQNLPRTTTSMPPLFVLPRLSK